MKNKNHLENSNNNTIININNNNKPWLIINIILIVVALLAIAVYFIWFHKGESSKKVYIPEVDQPEVFHDTDFNVDNLYGVWEENEVYYRYNDDGTGVTWDISDDVTEDEGTELEWEINKDNFIHYYKMDMGPKIPKSYIMKVLEVDSLIYEDDFGVRHAFSKVEELQLLN